jgi:hypothetical protein
MSRWWFRHVEESNPSVGLAAKRPNEIDDREDFKTLRL